MPKKEGTKPNKFNAFLSVHALVSVALHPAIPATGTSRAVGSLCRCRPHPSVASMRCQQDFTCRMVECWLRHSDPRLLTAEAEGKGYSAFLLAMAAGHAVLQGACGRGPWRRKGAIDADRTSQSPHWELVEACLVTFLSTKPSSSSHTPHAQHHRYADIVAHRSFIIVLSPASAQSLASFSVFCNVQQRDPPSLQPRPPRGI